MMTMLTWDEVKAAGDRFHDLQARHAQKATELERLSEELAAARTTFFEALVAFNTPQYLPPNSRSPAKPAKQTKKSKYESPPGAFACPEAGCNRTFATSRALAMHGMRVHRPIATAVVELPALPTQAAQVYDIPEAPDAPVFDCPAGCGAIYYSSAALERHLDTDHADEPPADVLADIEVTLADPT